MIITVLKGEEAEVEGLEEAEVVGHAAKAGAKCTQVSSEWMEASAPSSAPGCQLHPE